MKLTVETSALRRKFGEEKALEIIKNAGFDGVDFSFNSKGNEISSLSGDYIKNANTTKALLEKYGLICNQAHAPFVFKYEDTFNECNKNYSDILKAIEYASIIGCENLVVHYIKNDIPFDVDYVKYNLEFYNSFIPYLEKFNVKISVENLYRRRLNKKTYEALLCEPYRHLEFVNQLDKRYFNICLDIGHSSVTGYLPEEAIRVLGKNIKITHIHDTDYIEDSHMPPYTMSFNWDEIAKAFAEVGYSGNISMEIPSFIDKIPDSVIPGAMKFAHDLGRQLIKDIEKYKNHCDLKTI